MMNSNKPLLQQLRILFPEEQQLWQRIPSTRNILYKVRLKEGSRIVKLYPEERKSKMLAEYGSISCSAFPLKAYPCPKQDCFQKGEKRFYARIYSFLKGKPIPETAEGFFQLGKAIGSLHKFWAEQKKPDWLPSIGPEELITRPLEQLTAVVKEEELELPRCYAEQVRELLQAYRKPEFFGFCHGDTHSQNALLLPEGRAALFDFEDACWQWPAYDLATAIWGTFRFDGSPVLWNPLIEGYETELPLDDIQGSLLPYLLFARHLWWLGLYAENWESWQLGKGNENFFSTGLSLLQSIAEESCGLEARKRHSL
ncbi:MAG: phosphotransferase [Bacillota bacterium]|nr:phosphotransferase [Bacillota bacterium]